MLTVVPACVVGFDDSFTSPTNGVSGASGGYADFVFRSAAMELFGIDVGASALEWKTGRNQDIAELVLERDVQVLLRFARAYGFRNIQNVVRRVRAVSRLTTLWS